MHNQHISLWQHEHTFNIEKKMTEKRTLAVVLVTLSTMAGENFFGWLTNPTWLTSSI